MKLITNNSLLPNALRKISKYLDQDKSAKVVRRKFIDYFINEKNHTFVRSSPVVPFCDPTVAFVNAGMNQFKGVFLGTSTPEYKTAVNSQKCIRVGGKHNDLSVVGTDGYHHTFFEMLGNWSFGDYFKAEACSMAWELVTKHYKINKQFLYVTYFGGDENLNLPPDLECKEIWKKIGVPENRIIPFGLKDNFWEMGAVGPCGPCTEIHVDRRGVMNRYKFINKGLPDLVELWNIVFIQYSRNVDGSITSLPQNHIDTGMGFERLTAILQGKMSNYDTDIFSGIFSGISKVCKSVPQYRGKFGEADWNRLDTNYRILADHVRMITACLADGIIPEENQKLRRILRKSFLIGAITFNKNSGLIKELTNYVVENLGYVYPEMEKNINQIHQILDYEEEIFRSLRVSATNEWSKMVASEPRLKNLDVLETPGLIGAYKELKQQIKCGNVSPEMGFKLYDTFGLDEQTINKLAQAMDLFFDVNRFKFELELVKIKSKEGSLSVRDQKELKNNVSSDRPIPCTDDSHKYDYRKEEDTYVFEPVPVKVLAIVVNGEPANHITADTECNLILDQTNLYSKAGGQANDSGYIQFKDCTFQVSQLHNVRDVIFHQGVAKSENGDFKLSLNEQGLLHVDEENRLGNMRNHTATHILNAVLKQLKGVTCQKSSKVTHKYLKLDVGIFGPKLTLQELETLENRVNETIDNGVPVHVEEMNSQKLLSLDNVSTVPGEVYPENGIRLVEISDGDELLSREPCCGTHVFNTKDIEDFCIISSKSLGRSTTSLYAVTGDRAQLARYNGAEILDHIFTLEKNIVDNIDKPEILDIAINGLKQRLKFDIEEDTILPLSLRDRCLNQLNKIGKTVKETAKGSFKEFIDVEMQNVLETSRNKSKNNQEFIVHYLRCSTMLDTVPLQKATRLCKDVPILIISYSDNVVKARCCVPEKFRNKNFNAEKWIKETVVTIFKSSALAPKGQDGTLVCNMKEKKVNNKDWDTLLTQSLKAARTYAEKYL